MSYKSILDFAAIQLQAIIESADGIKIETEDFGWSNTRFVGDTFRMAHIERYSDSNLEVLHFTCFPLPTLRKVRRRESKTFHDRNTIPEYKIIIYE
jgi:hypothetical protein